MRFFNGKKVELLAPSGTPETFNAMVKANCDAIYLGGEQLNMRLMRKGYNFSDEQIVDAVKRARDEGKLVYITVNNMISQDELDNALRYLEFLNSIPVDAIIIQDVGLLQLCREHGFNRFALHTSVMMNLHNLDSIRLLQAQGVSRVILPREMDLQTARYVQAMTGIETEYFIHGDMCIANGANCYYSAVVFGNSSNRGRCFKPCRWPYRVKKNGQIFQTEFPLAAKDMYMYEHLPELIASGIMSFKIEGRMRDTDFIVKLVNAYGEALDRYLEDPLSFDRTGQREYLSEHRKRDFTTAYAFGPPGLDYINTRYEGTGKFYSTGKVFSTPTPEPVADTTAIAGLREKLKSAINEIPPARHGLSVKVNNLAQAKLALELGVDRIYLPTEVYAPDRPLSVSDLSELVRNKADTAIYLELPQMMTEQQVGEMDQFLSRHGQLLEGLVVTQPGALEKYARDYAVITSFNMNIYNTAALTFYRALGAQECTLSIEATGQDLAALLRESTVPLELIVHGPLKVMYLNHDLYANVESADTMAPETLQQGDDEPLLLLTDQGENPVYRDQYLHNHLMTAKELCLLPILDRLAPRQHLNYRIEGQTYSLDELRCIITTYQAALKNPETCQQIFSGMQTVRAGYTLGALSF